MEKLFIPITKESVERINEVHRVLRDVYLDFPDLLNMKSGQRINDFQEVIILDSFGFGLKHIKTHGIDGKLSECEDVYAEVKTINQGSLEYDIEIRCNKKNINFFEKNNVWVLVGLWDGKTNDLGATLCGNTNMIFDILKKHHDNYYDKKTNKINCRFNLSELIRCGFMVISNNYTIEETYNILVNKYKLLKNEDYGIKIEDIIPISEFNKDIFRNK